MADPELAEAERPQPRFGLGHRAQGAQGDRGAVGDPGGQAGRRRLVPGPQAEGLDHARTSALVNPASTSGKTAPRSAAACCPGTVVAQIVEVHPEHARSAAGPLRRPVRPPAASGARASSSDVLQW